MLKFFRLNRDGFRVQLTGLMVLVASLVFGTAFQASAQEVYATSVYSSMNVRNPANVANASHTDFATINSDSTLSTLQVRYPMSIPAPGTAVNFLVRLDSFPSQAFLSRVTIHLLSDSVRVERTFTGNQLAVSVVSRSQKIYAIRAITSFTDKYSYNQARLEIAGPTALPSDSNFRNLRIYDALAQTPCGGINSLFVKATSVFAAGTGTSPSLTSGYVVQPQNAVDADTSNFAQLVEPLNIGGLLPPAFIDLQFDRPQPAGNFVGFIVSNPAATSVGVLQALTITVFDTSGIQRESRNMFDTSNTTLLIDSPSKYLFGFTTIDNDYLMSRARLTLSSTVGAQTSISVYNGVEAIRPAAPIMIDNSDSNGRTTACFGDSIRLVAYDSLSAGKRGYRYRWSNGDTTLTTYAKTSGTYTLTITDSAGCSRTSFPIVLTIRPQVVVTITGDSSFVCARTSGRLYTTQRFRTYAWSTGSSADTITVSTAGRYSVRVTDSMMCFGSDTIQVVCQDTVKPDDPNNPDNPNNPGNDTADFVIHDFFSPNGDGVNDYFVIEGLERYPNNTLRIFDKFGTKVYEQDGYNGFNGKQGWDGEFRHSGNVVPDGTYYYILRLNAPRARGNEFKGFIMVAR